MGATPWTLTLFAVRLLPLAELTNGLQCWGGNAIALQRGGGEAKSCTAGADRFSLFRYDQGNAICYEKCAGVTWFEGFSTGTRPFANPDGKRLCPGVVDKHECAHLAALAALSLPAC